MLDYIMALDQGTTSSRCILFNKRGEIRAKAQKEFPQYYPKPGWVEQNPIEIWSSQYSVMMEAASMLTPGEERIHAIGITNQRETAIVWNKNTGEPVYPAIVWQCRRTAEAIDHLKDKSPDFADYLTQKTGLIPDAYFSATKIAWILDHVKGAREEAEAGNLLFGTVDTWLIWKLTNGKEHVTDYTNASRTMLFDIHKLTWDKEILNYFGIPASMFPTVRPSSSICGYADLGIFGGEIPIAGVAGDQQAALFGQCAFKAGDVKNTYGTGCFLLMNLGKDPRMTKEGLLTTIAASRDSEDNQSGEVEYAMEGSVFAAGSVIQWLRDELRLIEKASDTEASCNHVADSGGVYLVPAFSGLGTPYWNPYARGTMVGLTRACTKDHFIRAAVESVAYQVYDVLSAMEKASCLKVNAVRVDGGASANNFLMQFQADLSGVPVERPDCIETTALGAAYLSGLATGYWKNKEEIMKNRKTEFTFYPNQGEEEKRLKTDGWKKAVKCALIWAEDQVVK